MPTGAHGRLAVIWLDTQAGVCVNVSTDLNNITLNRSANHPESTTFGDRDTQREYGGLRDVSVDVTGVWITGGASQATTVLEDAFSGSLVTRMQYLPAGSFTGSPIYTGCMRLTSYNLQSPVDGITTTQFSLALAAGSLTSACAV